MNQLLGKTTWILTITATGLFVLAVWPEAEQQKSLSKSNQETLGNLLSKKEVRPLTHHQPSVPKADAEPDQKPTLAMIKPPVTALEVGPPVAEFVRSNPPTAHDSSLDRDVEQPKVSVTAKRQRQSLSPAKRPMPRRRQHTQLAGHTKARTTKNALPTGVWPEATELQTRLDVLSSDQFPADVQNWSSNVRTLLDKLQSQKWTDYTSSDAILRSLTNVAKQNLNLLNDLEDDRRVHAVRAKYALIRRLSVWRAIAERAQNREGGLPVVQAGATDVMKEIAIVNAAFQHESLRKSWQTFLGLKELEKACRGDLARNERRRRKLARQFLRRMKSPSLSTNQADYLRRLPTAQLTTYMKGWADAPINHDELLRRLERFELRNDGISATRLGRVLDTVRWSQANSGQLNEAFNVHYRNSNLRVAISEKLINRLLPDPQVEQREVFDEILGAEVFSQSRVLNRLRLILVPDRRRWRMGLEAHGEIDSESSSTKGPATFYNEGVSQYRARKLVLVDRRGIRLARARANANSQSTLTDVETGFDSVPILNLLARGIAINQHDSSSEDAQIEVEQRVADMASTRLDKEVESHVAKATSEFRRKVITPLHRLELNPQTTDMRTTKQRIIARYRIAGVDQLAALAAVFVGDRAAADLGQERHQLVIRLEPGQAVEQAEGNAGFRLHGLRGRIMGAPRFRLRDRLGVVRVRLQSASLSSFARILP